MIINTKDGCVISGTITKDVTTRQAGQHLVSKFSVKYGSEATAPGEKRKGKFLDVDCWGQLQEVAQFLRSGDGVVVSGEVQSREYNGKTYRTLRAETLCPDLSTVLRLMQGGGMLQPQGTEDVSASFLPPETTSTPATTQTEPLIDSIEDLPF